jgi:hypothetical protein
LVQWCWDPPEWPRDETVRRLANGLTRRLREFKRDDLPLVTFKSIMGKFGWKWTYEEEIQRNPLPDRFAIATILGRPSAVAGTPLRQPG